MELFLLALVIQFIIYLWLMVSAFTRSVVWGILALVLAPFLGIAYGIVHFRDAKLPFLLYLAAAVFAVVAFFMITPKEWIAVCERVPVCSAAKDTALHPPAQPLTPPGVTPVPTGSSTLPTPTGVANTSVPSSSTVVLPTPVPSPTPTPIAAAATNKQSDSNTDSEEEETDPMANFPKSHAMAQEDPLEVKKTAPPKLTETINPARVGKYLNRYLIITMTNNVERRGMLKKVTKTSLIMERKFLEKGTTTFSVSRQRIKHIKVLREAPRE